MTVKEYLSQLEKLNNKIRHKKQELYEAKVNRGIITQKEGERVQTSISGSERNETESQAIRIAVINEDINNSIIEGMELRHKIIDQIHDLKDGLHIEILYRRYVRVEKDFTRMACDLGYSYKYIINKHGDALAEFEKVHSEILLLESDKNLECGT